MTKIKICGIRNLDDAEKAQRLGADAIGLLVGQKHASPDFISPEAARSIVERQPPFISTVLVTHFDSAESIGELLKVVGPSTLQLHGNSVPEDAVALRDRFPHLKIYKALHANANAQLARQVQLWGAYVDAILLDTYAQATDQVGGTGTTHDWTISANIVRTSLKPVILAGGLTATNVSKAIAAVHPYAVDVNSGTKNAQGFKDENKIRDFIAAVHRSTKDFSDAYAGQSVAS